MTEQEIQHTIAGMAEQTKTDLLVELVHALHAENTDECYRLLRNYDLEADHGPYANNQSAAAGDASHL